jgi:co-chaperonin GroES (HSP10)
MFRVLDDKVAIIPVSDPDKYGSIIIPESVREGKRPDQGVVYSCGPRVKDVTVGDHVLFSPYSGSKVTVVDVGVLHVMPESEIVAWLDDEEAEQMFPLSLAIRLIRDACAIHSVAVGSDFQDVQNRIVDEFKNHTLSRGLEY